MLRIVTRWQLRRACPHPPHRVFWSARRMWTGRHEWHLFCDECSRFLSGNYACHHCGATPEHDGDHTCSCPNRDEDCLEHPEN